jgi:hypothetical protein
MTFNFRAGVVLNIPYIIELYLVIHVWHWAFPLWPPNRTLRKQPLQNPPVGHFVNNRPLENWNVVFNLASSDNWALSK